MLKLRWPKFLTASKIVNKWQVLPQGQCQLYREYFCYVFKFIIKDIIHDNIQYSLLTPKMFRMKELREITFWKKE